MKNDLPLLRIKQLMDDILVINAGIMDRQERDGMFQLYHMTLKTYYATILSLALGRTDFFYEK